MNSRMNNLTTAIRTRLSARTIYGVILLIIFGVALSIRVFLPYEGIFTENWVRFGGQDPWYHMRLVENLVQHFPQSISFDPYTFFPHGQEVFFAPFFDLFLGFLIWSIGLGSPTQQTIETVGAYFPAILGALTTIPVYLIGRELFNRNVGLLAAALIAILPGQFLFRSLLGFTDHHVAEVLLSTVMILFVILALKRAQEGETSFKHIRSWDWRNIRKPLVYALLAGITLGMYLLSWVGGMLFILILVSYGVVQYILDYLRDKSTDYLCIIGVPMFLVTLIVIAPLLSRLAFQELCLMSLIVAVVTFPVLSGVAKLMESRNIRRTYYPLALLGIALAGLAALYVTAPSLFGSLVDAFSVFTKKGAALTIAEVKPLLFPYGAFSLQLTWHYFTTGFFIALISLFIMAYTVIKEGAATKTLLLTWSLIMLVATLSQNRFAYYFAVNVAILAGYFCWKILEWGGRGRGEIKDRRKLKGTKRRVSGREPRRLIPNLTARYVIALIIVFFLAFYPNIGKAIATASSPATPDEDRHISLGPSDDWYNSLLWMRHNTPDPFPDPDFYYKLYERPPANKYDYPESAYGVMTWWDHGHWVTYIAHRIPNANPHQAGATGAALFFTATGEPLANKILGKLGSKYVIIDYQLATAKFPGVSVWAGKEPAEFLELYYQRTPQGKLSPIWLYYPQYYRSMCSRLYNFTGKRVVPDNSTQVISYVDRIDAKGNSYKEISSSKLFPTYGEAKAYLDSKESPYYKIVGTDPFTSPVPLEELKHYELIYQSDSIAVPQGDGGIAYVEIFEYLP